ncbi:MAG: ABC transporter permease [Halococcoides sp.]
MNIEPPSQNVFVIAKKDFRDAARSKLIWALTALFVLVEVLAGVLEVEFAKLQDGAAPAADEIARSIAGHVLLFVALGAIIVAFKSIAGERESGSIKFLLSLPNSRVDVVLGKVLGRWMVLVVPFLAGMSVGTLVGWIRIGETDIVAFLLAVLAVALFAFAFVSIIVAFSTAFESTMRVIAASLLVFVMIYIGWNFVPIVAWLSVEWALAGEFTAISKLAQDPIPVWVFYLDALSPVSAFDNTINIITGRDPSVRLPPFIGPIMQAFIGFELAESRWATNWLGPISLAFWSVVPLVVAIVRFELDDL